MCCTKLKPLLFRLFIVFLLFTGSIACLAQRPSSDTAYIEDHTKDLTIRLFSGNKYSNYRLDQKHFRHSLTYKSNDNYNIGAGFNYRYLGLNIGIKMPFINNDNDIYGLTRRLDLQSYIYMRRFTIDLYGQFYKGYYLKSNDMLKYPPAGDTYLLRPDLLTRGLGFNVQYIFNHNRFSYRAAYLQNEYQRKTAGSAIAGIGIHHFSVRGDSAIIPSNIVEEGFFSNSRFDQSRAFCFSLNGGYVQTVVVRDHFFITAAWMGGIGPGATWVTDKRNDITDKSSGLNLSSTVRMAAGYNSNRYFAGIQYVNFISRNSAPFAGSWQESESGMVRLTVAKRFVVRSNVINQTIRQLTPKP